MRRKQICLHEARHAVQAYRTGRSLMQITVIGPERAPHKGHPQTTCYCQYVSPERPTGCDFEDVPIFLAPALLEYRAGNLSQPAVEETLAVMGDLLRCDSDEQRLVIRAARTARKSSRNPRRQARAFLQAMQEKTPLPDKKDQEAIEALAEALMSAGKLSGYEAAIILEAAYKGTPQGALPLFFHRQEPASRTEPGAWGYALELLEKVAAEIRLGANLDDPEAERFLTDLNSIRFRAAWLKSNAEVRFNLPQGRRVLSKR